MRHTAPASPQPPLARRPGPVALLGLAGSLLLTACSSTPLPPWPSSLPPARQVVRIPPPERATTSQPLPASSSTPPAAVQVQPLPPAEALAALPQGQALDYPDPAEPYVTPGLAPDRRAMSTNAEVRQWLARLALGRGQSAPHRLLDLGLSQRGETLQALLLTRSSPATPAQLETDGRPTVLLLGQQHGDEAASSEALLVLAQELAQGPLSALLDRVNVLVLPRANPDGALQEQALLANGLDLEEDHLLLRSPEARAIARLMRDYHPLVVADAREFPVQRSPLRRFGGLPLQDLQWQAASTPHYPEFLAKAAREWFIPPLQQALQAAGLRGTVQHQAGTDPQDRRLDLGSLDPDAGHNTLGLHGAVSLRLASRGADLGREHLQRRVHAQVVALRSVLRSSAERAAALQQIRSFVERDTSAQACRASITLSARRETQPHTLLLRHPDTGAEQRQSLEALTPERWQALDTRTRPCGYWLGASNAPTVERLRQLDLRVLRIAEAGTVLTETNSNAPPGADRRFSAFPRSVLDVPAGSYYLPLNQPGAALAIAALEAGTPYGYLAHGLLAQASEVARVMAVPELVFDDQEP